MIRVQQEDFNIGNELNALTAGRTDIGGLASFVGLVRDFVEPNAAEDTATVSAMTLEHYPGMTEKMLAEIEVEANHRWPLQATLVIHRYGTLQAGERIVLVACAAAHREDALQACSFLIDWLKIKAPFWKREDTENGPRWVVAKESDNAFAARWNEG